MRTVTNRRNFNKAVAVGLGAAALPGLPAAQRGLRIGYTCLTWGAAPGRPAPLDPALKEIASLGFWEFETFAEVLEEWDTKGGLRALIDQYGIPLNAGYFVVNVTDPAQRKDNVPLSIRLAKVVRKYGGNFLVFQVNGLKRAEYKFEEHRANIVSILNDCAMAINDVGLGAGLHQHTGTAVETRDEVYAVMEAVNTRHVKFAPDVGQLQRGGADAAKVVRDFLSIVEHMHVKDFDGTRYCPLGQGKVDIAGILKMLGGVPKQPNLNVELDSSKPLTPLEAAQVTKKYLQGLGHEFRA